MKNIVLATGNTHKVAEFAKLLNGLPWAVNSAATCGGMPEVVEDGDSFAANAQIKADALRRLAPSGAYVLADDSGLEVDALDGAPGIYSARYAGADAGDRENVDRLLHALNNVAPGQRSARFRCVLCLVTPLGEAVFYEGDCEGRISESPRGKSGFGYDPVFIPAGFTESFAELGDAIKSRLSHRARAVGALRAGLAQF